MRRNSSAFNWPSIHICGSGLTDMRLDRGVSHIGEVSKVKASL